MELSDFNDNSSSCWAPEWKSKPSFLQRPDVFNFQGCGFESLSFQVVERSGSNWNSSRIFIVRCCPQDNLPAKTEELTCEPHFGYYKPADLGAVSRQLLKVSVCGEGEQSEPQPALKHIHSGNYGPPTQGRKTSQLRAKLRQSKCQPWQEAKENFQWGSGVSPGHKEHNTDNDRQEFGCIFLSFFCNKISSVILASRDSNLLYAAAKV